MIGHVVRFPLMGALFTKCAIDFSRMSRPISTCASFLRNRPSSSARH